VSKRLGDQLLRSGTSILGNYVEGQAASSKKDFTNYFNTSLKSTNESKLWLALLRDSKRAKADEVTWFLQELPACRARRACGRQEAGGSADREEIGNIFA